MANHEQVWAKMKDLFGNKIDPRKAEALRLMKEHSTVKCLLWLLNVPVQTPPNSFNSYRIAISDSIRKELNIQRIIDQRNVSYNKGTNKLNLLICDKHSGSFQQWIKYDFEVLFVIFNNKCMLEIQVRHQILGTKKEYFFIGPDEQSFNRFDSTKWLEQLPRIVNKLQEAQIKTASSK
jgi:hypothetical protein